MTTDKELKRMCEGIAAELRDVYDGDAKNEDGEDMTFWAYFEDVLDIEYSVSGDLEYRGVRLMVTCGGPNIWVDTRRGEVVGAWWTDSATAWIPREVCDAIDEVWEEYFNCYR